MTPADLHSAAVRCLNDLCEDNPTLSHHDLKTLFAASFAMVVGLPPTQAMKVKPRFTARQVRSIVWPILDCHLTGADSLELMNEIDKAMALGPVEKK